MKRLFTNMGWLLGGRGINAVLSLVYLALATRTLGAEGFGWFAIIVALGQAITGIANFQTWQFIVRWGANGEGAGEATGFAIALDLLSMVVGTALAALLTWSLPLWLPLPPDLLWLTFGYCLVSLLSVRSTPTGLLRLNFKYAIATAAETVQPVIRAGGAVLAWLYMPTVEGFIIAFAFAEVAVTAALWFAAARTERIDLSALSLTRIPARHKDAWRFVVSTNLSGSLNVAGKQVMNLGPGEKLTVVRPVSGDHVAVVSQNGKFLVFPMEELPEMARGKGVRLQKYKDGGLSDATTFALADGLRWRDPAGRTRTEADLGEWIGARAGTGRMAPRGFPRDNRFD